MSSRFLNIKEAASILDSSEEEIRELIDKKELKVYKIAGQIIRFKEEDLINLKSKLKSSKVFKEEESEYTFTEKLVDFLYFNDFYILAVLLIFLILAIIFFGIF